MKMFKVIIIDDNKPFDMKIIITEKQFRNLFERSKTNNEPNSDGSMQLGFDFGDGYNNNLKPNSKPDNKFKYNKYKRNNVVSKPNAIENKPNKVALNPIEQDELDKKLRRVDGLIKVFHYVYDQKPDTPYQYSLHKGILKTINKFKNFLKQPDKYNVTEKEMNYVLTFYKTSNKFDDRIWIEIKG